MPSEECEGLGQNVSFFYSQTNKTISEQWKSIDFVVVGLGVPVCFLIILANLMVMVAILVNRSFHYPVYYLLGNMAAADLFAGISYFNLIFHTGPWTITLSQQQWFVRGALIEMSLTASVLNLLAVALERHQTIFTMQLHSTMSNRRVLLLIVFIWVVAIIMGLVPTMGWNCVCQTSLCSTVAPLYSRSFLVFWALLNLLTFSIMVAIYTRIFVYVRRKNQSMTLCMVQDKTGDTLVSLMKTVSMILGAFVICWTPGLVILLLDGLNCSECQVLKYEKYCLVLAECNSLVNPIIYSCRDKEMRKTFKRILCFLCRRGIDPESEPPNVQSDTLKRERLLKEKYPENFTNTL
ncbi:lysophosphatidic acid receptor 2a [Astyanax mexicanus]|uniref:Lysophosphatidic acid receptor 2 n=2 Tax=Astyanax mexicanus TaxID=7994 RepID=A0A8B9J691_ASTMX|nr:lysophosphatidic acid receptor 2a [Astyanax mexicanus]KAG9279001.1 lysophosphatidic acid receptor 2 [Astyanax mexicanus]